MREAQGAHRQGAPSSRQGWTAPAGLGLAAACVGLLAAAHLAYGALLAEPSLLLTAGSAIIVLGCVATPGLRRDLTRVRGLPLPALLFSFVLAWGVLSLTPWMPGGPHPTWAYLDLEPAAATLDKSATALELIKLLGLACIFAAGLASGATDDRARTALNALTLVAALIGLWAFLGFTTGVVVPSQRGRLDGHFLSPNTAGTFFAASLVLAVGLLARRMKGLSAVASLSAAPGLWSATLILAVCLLLTASRGAFLSAGVAFGAFLLLRFFGDQRLPSRNTVLSLVAILLVFAALFLFGEPLLARFATIEADAAFRTETYKLHWQAFLAAPISGYGLGTFDTVHRTLLDAASVPELWRTRALHNVYIQWLEEAGVPGALAMFGAIGAITVIAARRGLRRSRMTLPLFALVSSNLVFLTHGVSDFALQTPSVAFFWSYLLGLQFALSQGSGR